MIDHKKDIFKFEKTFDFNELAKLLDSAELFSRFVSDNVNPSFILESPIKIEGVEKISYFQGIFNYLNKNYNTQNIKNNVYLFFSFTAGSKGLAHSDIEDVVIVGLYGKTLYIIDEKNYIIEKGDMIKIPKGVVHRGIGLEPRIILSFGVYR
jgi:hypothetical protein|tara:strand:+ start:221 stop:676 length:456 start_codon:yes stop_codon:yes gene_type:complete